MKRWRWSKLIRNKRQRVKNDSAIPDSLHFATMREALASLGKAETHLLLGALILVRLRSRDSFNEIGEILSGELLNGCNHIPKFLPFFGEMILDARRDLQESSPLHEPHLFQDLEPLCERLRQEHVFQSLGV